MIISIFDAKVNINITMSTFFYNLGVSSIDDSIINLNINNLEAILVKSSYTFNANHTDFITDINNSAVSGSIPLSNQSFLNNKLSTDDINFPILSMTNNEYVSGMIIYCSDDIGNNQIPIVFINNIVGFPFQSMGGSLLISISEDHLFEIPGVEQGNIPVHLSIYNKPSITSILQDGLKRADKNSVHMEQSSTGLNNLPGEVRANIDIDSAFIPHPLTGAVTTKSNIGAIQQKIKNFVLTRKGDYFTNYDVGCGVLDFQFDNWSPLFEREFKENLILGLINNIKEIDIDDISFYNQNTKNLGIIIQFRMLIDPNKTYSTDIRIKRT